MLKIKYMIDYEEVLKYNKLYENFDIIKLENFEGAIGPGETKYVIAYFRTLAEVKYKIDLKLQYTDETRVFEETITIQGEGYLPLKKELFIQDNSKEKEDLNNKEIIPLNKIPNKMIWNFYNKEMIQKCGFNIEELNFGSINDKKYKTVILYNYSNKYSFNFDIVLYLISNYFNPIVTVDPGATFCPALGTWELTCPVPEYTHSNPIFSIMKTASFNPSPWTSGTTGSFGSAEDGAETVRAMSGTTLFGSIS